MTYQQIIQSVGKQITKEVYYYDESNKKIDVDIENIEEAKITFNCSLTGTLMQGLELILKEQIDTTKAIYLIVNAQYGEETNTKTYGPYYLKECEYNADEKTYTHTCYDEILKTMVDYVPFTMTYPTTVQNYYNKLIETLGLTSSVSLINGNVSMASDVYSGINYTYRTVLDDLATANGILLYVDGTEVKEASFGNDSTKAEITDDILKNTNIDFGTHFGPINSIVLSRSGDSDNIYKRDEESITTNGLHEYKISDNQMMNQNNRSDFLNGLLSKLDGTEFDIFDTELVGWGGFTPLQRVEFTTGGQTYKSYVFNNEIDITEGWAESIYTDEPTESETDYTAADKTDNKINQTYIIVNKQNQTIESVVSTVDTQNDKISQITQTVDELNSKISDIADITTSNESVYGTVSLENINESEPIMIKIHPTSGNISYLYPSSGLYPSSSTYLKTRTLRFYNTKTEEIIDWELPTDLWYYDSDNYDDLVLSYESLSLMVNRKIGINEDGTTYILDNPTTESYDFPSIPLTEGDYTITLLGYSNAYLFARLMANNIYTTQFATKVELNSAINQTESSITASVEEKVTKLDGQIDTISGELALKVGKNDNDQIVSMLNASADEINLTSNRLVVDSTNFKLTADGTITANAGTFGGTINTSKDLTVGDNAYIGQNQSSSYSTKKYLYFSDKSYLQRTKVGSSEMLSINGDFMSLNYDEYVQMNKTGDSNNYTRISENYFTISMPNIYFSTQPVIGSDIRLKDNISDINVDWINNLNVKEYEYKANLGKKQIGLIAQDYVDKEYSKYFLNKNDDGYYSIAYGNINNALIKYCQELNNKINNMQSEIDELKKLIKESDK